MPASPSIKGSSLINTRKVLLRDYGELATNHILRSLPEDVRNHAENALVTSWVPLDKFYVLLEAIKSELGTIDKEINYRIGKAAPQITYGRFYKMFFKLGKPQLVVKRAPLMWSNLMSVGRVESVRCDDHGTVGQVLDFLKPTPSFARGCSVTSKAASSSPERGFTIRSTPSACCAGIPAASFPTSGGRLAFP